MKRFIVKSGGKFQGKVSVPGDKSIGHRSLIFAALADGPSTIDGLSGGLDNLATAEAFASMGVPIRLEGQRAEAEGVGLSGLKRPTKEIDCGNSGTTIRMLSGLLVGQRFGVRMVGDESLGRRPMGRVVGPLRARGGHIAGVSGAKEGEQYPPLSVAPLIEGETLSGIEYDMPVASAQVKSALLLSGLYADGVTAIREPVLSRDHTERMMVSLGVPLETFGPMVVFDPSEWRRGWKGFDWTVPGDFSSAAFMMVAACIAQKGHVHLSDVGLNPTRTGLADALKTMGAQIELTPKGTGAGDEPVGDISMRPSSLSGQLMGGELLVRMIDEVPALCAAAALAKGVTEIRDAKELRVKESDRIAVMSEVLHAFGVECKELEDGLVIQGKGDSLTDAPLKAAEVHSRGDHRIAMTGVLLGMKAVGETIIHDVDCVDTSFPGFVEIMRDLGAQIEVYES